MTRNRVGRLCSICTHPLVESINRELVEHAHGFRIISRRYGVQPASLQRHAATHLRETIRASEEARMLASTESLIAELNRLHDYTSRVLERGERLMDDRLVLAGVDTARKNVETLARLGPMSDVERRLTALENPATKEENEE